MHALVLGLTFKWVFMSQILNQVLFIQYMPATSKWWASPPVYSCPLHLRSTLVFTATKTEHTDSKNRNQQGGGCEQICELTKNKALDFDHLTGKKPKQTATKHQCWGHKSQVFVAFGDDNWVLVLCATWAVTWLCPLQNSNEWQKKCVGHSTQHEKGWKGVYLITATWTILLNVAVTSSVVQFWLKKHQVKRVHAAQVTVTANTGLQKWWPQKQDYKRKMKKIANGTDQTQNM